MTAYEKYKQFLKDCPEDEALFFIALEEYFDVSGSTALDLWYAPQRSWFKPEMMDEIVRLDRCEASTFRPNFFSGDFDWDGQHFIPEGATNVRKKKPQKTG